MTVDFPDRTKEGNRLDTIGDQSGSESFLNDVDPRRRKREGYGGEGVGT